MPVPLPAARALAADVLRPGHFFATIPLAWTHHETETSRWEVFQGRLLDPAHTRQQATFETWNVHEERDGSLSPEPILSLKLDASRGILHVVRGVECHVHEAYSEGNVIQTREARRWVRELVASFELARYDEAALREEVALALSRAVTGTRLPLTPVEAPLPAFTFGRLFYSTSAGPSHRELEYFLRRTWAGMTVEDAATIIAYSGGYNAEPLRTLRSIFDEVSLSPWTDLVAKVLRVLSDLENGRHETTATILEFESSLLRLVCRHLTAYDLVTFHHRGANYPDALLLDALLNDYLSRLERNPTMFSGVGGRVRRRRALRQAYLVRRRYEGHPVPDAPTSPGEWTRVLPDDHPRVPEEQILNPAARKRKLYDNDPLLPRLTPAARAVLRASLDDLAHPDERQELGAGVYLDRPFGGAKAPVEPDATPLVASLAYSRSIAAQRLRTLCNDLGVPEPAIDLDLPGLPLDRIGPPPRLGTVSLSDAARAAPDFAYRYTLPGSVRALREWIDLSQFADRLSGRVLIAREPVGPALLIYDANLAPFARLTPRLGQGYVCRRGVEYPAEGVAITPAESAG